MMYYSTTNLDIYMSKFIIQKYISFLWNGRSTCEVYWFGSTAAELETIHEIYDLPCVSSEQLCQAYLYSKQGHDIFFSIWKDM